MSIEENILRIRNELPKEVNLIAVSKTKPVEQINEVYNLGVRDFGENKVQEFLDKADNLPSDIRWHLIGHLQTNKVKYIVGKVYLIHSLDSVKLLYELEKRYGEAGIQANVLIQINIAKEETKTGAFIEELEDLLVEIEKCKNVKVKGLMSIIPIGDEQNCRHYFKAMKKLWDNLKNRTLSNITMEYLSMGMSSDYKLAISEGANLIRIGEGIFGKRIYNNK